MKDSVEKIQYKGKTILYSDYSGLGGNEFLRIVQRHYEQHMDIFKTGESQCLVLTNVTDAFADKAVIKLFKDATKQNKPFIKKSAVVGISGIQKILVKAVNAFSSMDNEVFDTREEALEWLVQ